MTVANPRTSLDQAIFATVAYADVFDMPIEIERIQRFLVGETASLAEVEAGVERLVASARLTAEGRVVHLAGREAVMSIYRERTARAETMWADAERWGRRIARVPFVRMVAVTGGLAVDSVADHDDIDYLLVTRPGRLWLSRLMVIVLVRIAAREDIELCPNYLLSDRALDLDEREVYVARELAQMVPIVGPSLCRELRSRNAWMFDYLPNATVDGDLSRSCDQQPGRLQRAAEALLLSPPFARLERWEMKRKVAKLTLNPSRRAEVGAPDESSFSPDVCKGHLVGNAAGINQAWQDRLET